MSASDKLMLRIEEVCEILEVSRNTGYKLVRDKVIPSCMVGNSIRVPRKALMEWIEANTVKACG